jgi:ribonuclease P protein subunit POP4
MPLTPETLPRHELAGLPVRVVESTDPGQVGTAGRVVRETTNTIHVADGEDVTVVPKRGTRFAFALEHTDEATGAGPGTASELPWDTAGQTGQSGGCEDVVTVDGGVLIARPARRTEHGVDTQW